MVRRHHLEGSYHEHRATAEGVEDHIAEGGEPARELRPRQPGREFALPLGQGTGERRRNDAPGQARRRRVERRIACCCGCYSDPGTVPFGKLSQWRAISPGVVIQSASRWFIM